jgi:DNA (cytosine-5)-methyltransferase 1
MRKASWLDGCDEQTRLAIRECVDNLRLPRADRGRNFIVRRGRAPILNHSTRGHKVEDLERYMFASAFAQVHGRSPFLTDFPRTILPEHANIDRSTGEGDFTDRFRVQLQDEPGTTVTSHISKDGHYYIHHDPGQCRSLTVREAARLQTFPDDYFFCGARTAQFEQVGNAVPPALATRIAGIVAEVLGA